MADKRWEYEVDELKSGCVSPGVLNEWGARGWELVAVIPNQPISLWLILKREVPPDYSFLQAKIETDADPGADGAQRPERSEGP